MATIVKNYHGEFSSYPVVHVFHSPQVAMVEVNLTKDIPDGLLVGFAVCTTLLVAVHMLALMISTCILPNVEAVGNMHALGAVNESPHRKLHWYIETAWAFSTVLGILLFLCEIGMLSWVVFYNYSHTAAWVTSVLLVPILAVFVMFTLHFYRQLVAHKYEITESGIRELEDLHSQLQASAMMKSNSSGTIHTAVNVV